MPHSVRGGPSSAESARCGKMPLTLVRAEGLENEIATIVAFLREWFETGKLCGQRLRGRSLFLGTRTVDKPAARTRTERGSGRFDKRIFSRRCSAAWLYRRAVYHDRSQTLAARYI